MFGLIRLVILTMFAFVAGLLYERANAGERCGAAGGEMQAGLCVGASG